MSCQQTYEYMAGKLLNHFMISNKYFDFCKHFYKDKSVEEMFSYLWELGEAHQFLQINLLVKSKKDGTADQLRKEGNKFYQNKDLQKALELYNKSIIYSPQPNVNNAEINLDGNSSTSSEISSRNLANGYANRSAVLFELGNYEGCLTDISRSIQYGYPAILRPKLVERQAKCYLAQHNSSKAQEIVKECLSSLKSLGLEEHNSIQTKSNLELLLKQSKFEVPEINENYKYLTRIVFPESPSVERANAKIPSLSEAVDLAYETGKGRFLVANRDIMPGEVLIKEKGFGCVVHPEKLLSHCSYCLRRTLAPVPCPNCISVVFCCEKCCTDARNQFHDTECCLLPTLIALDVGNTPLLALRFVIQLTLLRLKEKVSQFGNAGEGNSKATAGFNEQNMYCSDNYSTVYHFDTNRKHRSHSDLFKRCSVAFCLVKLLLKTKYFGNQVFHDNQRIEEDIKLVGTVLVTHLMSLLCNSVAISELACNVLDSRMSYLEIIGNGAFSVYTLACHSCNHNLNRSHYGSVLVSRAIQFIPKGSEVTSTYGQHYADHCTTYRQASLKEQYFFQCSCEACTIWSFPLSVATKLTLKCPRCTSSIDFNASKCPKCRCSTSDLFYLDNAAISARSLGSKIEQSVGKFKESYQNVVELNNVVIEEENIADAVYWLTKYCSQPYETIFDAVEVFKHCFDMNGHHYYLN